MYPWTYPSPFLNEDETLPPLTPLESIIVCFTFFCLALMCGLVIVVLLDEKKSSNDELEQRKRAQERLTRISSYESSDQEKTSSCNNHYCVICLEDYNPGDPCQRFPFCNHIFHSECIRLWLNFQLTCPICRTSIWRSRKIKKYRPTRKINRGQISAHVDLQGNNNGVTAAV
ncbi:hypothetical protein RGQ29_027330 [Quercus rubra]|uniref:RING-type domain-containing protein n=1 Tax=Quercus rubra TaxID=3512 RepID=A0AAN7EP38_QUERU|nr:hypothetical protein RGQ29_027330 [Quercus rubra]